MRLIYWIRQILARLSNLQLNIYAANAAFFILLAAFPSLMLILAVLSLTPLTTSDFLSLLEGVVPSSIVSIFSYFTTEMIPSSHTATISITIVAVLWAASRGVLGMLRGLNAVYHVKETRSYLHLRLISMFYMLLVVAMLLVMLVLHVFGQKIQSLLIAYLPDVAIITQTVLQLKTVLTSGLLMLLFTMIYTVFPNRRIQIGRAIPGALAAAIGWQVFSFGFSLYINYLAGYSIVYGSLTTVVFSILWLYFCIYILLLGGLLNYYLELRRRTPRSAGHL